MAHAALTRGYPRSFETGDQIARASMQAAIDGLPDDYFDTFVARVRAVDAAAVTGAAARWTSPADLFAVVVGDRARIEADLRAVMPRVEVAQGRSCHGRACKALRRTVGSARVSADPTATREPGEGDDSVRFRGWSPSHESRAPRSQRCRCRGGHRRDALPEPIFWLLLTDPVTVADALKEGE